MDNKKIILYLITQSEYAGAQRYVFDLARNISDDFNVIVAFGEQGERGGLAQKLKNENIEYFVIPNLKRAINNPWHDLLALFQIIKLIKKTKPDVIHLNSTKISILGSLAGFFIRITRINSHIRIIFTAHGWIFNEPLPYLKKLFYKYSEKFTSVFKNKIICVSNHDYQTAIRQKICKKEKLITIHNGIEEIQFLSREQAQNKLGPEIKGLKFDNYFLFVTMANFYPTKGIKYLIEAANILKTKNHQFRIIIFGDGQERNKIEEMIKRYHLEDIVILAGRIDNAARLLKGFDAYVCSSVKEGFPYAIIEAMQSGLPIVTTRAGGIAEMITDQQTGLLVDTKNSEELAQKMKKIIETSHPGKMGLQARDKALQEFNLEKMIDKTSSLY